ncbi:MAG: UDP-4-amino-4,6-dideoxy-N-acetyl-beta-L-altrosamine transaminase [Deferribacterales bacterium]|nr:UDP-4-amino-4,6-dideoxy-N-acetyl-beta-L-altrosamine transaminase [Deferribacterales bacterium]
MINGKHISYGKQWIDDHDIEAVIKVLKSDFLTQGEYVPLFEQELARYTKSKFACAVSSGTAALHIAYMLLDLKAGDEVITSPMTFAATANAVLYTGAKPVFVDIEADTGLIDVRKIEKAVTPKTKAITCIHYGGLPCATEEIKAIADKYNLYVIEDACHALGAAVGGDVVGSCRYSDISVFSFHPVKHITTGEGGALTLNNAKLYNRALSLRSHGIVRSDFRTEPDSPVFQEMAELGNNYRLTELQAALGISQLQRLDGFLERRRQIAAFYRREFQNISSFSMQAEIEGCNHAYHLFPLIFNSHEARDEAFLALKERGVFCQIHYVPVNRHYYYMTNGYNYNDTPLAYDFYRRELSIPIYPKMTDSEAAFVAESVKAVTGDLK